MVKCIQFKCHICFGSYEFRKLMYTVESGKRFIYDKIYLSNTVRTYQNLISYTVDGGIITLNDKKKNLRLPLLARVM